MKLGAPGQPTIRVRLGVALALALLPVLVLGIIQAVIASGHEGHERRLAMTAAAEHSAYVARARLESATVLLQTLSPAAVGFDCMPRLHEAVQRTQGISNLIRFDRVGRVECAADSVPADPDRRNARWFQELAEGAPVVIERAPGPETGPATVLVASRAVDSAGAFDGALVGLIRMSSLRPPVSETTPRGSEVELVGRDGDIITQSDRSAFRPLTPDQIATALREGSVMAHGRDARGRDRLYTAAPLVGQRVLVVLSAPAAAPFTWARVSLLSGVLFPILTFFLALSAVWIVADRVIVRWLHYIERVAAIYAKGRFSVRPLQAEKAPPEIRALAHTLEIMAEGIVSRDSSLKASIAQQDALMREIHHRVKNNLQVITSLLNMQQRTLTDPAARAAMSDTRQRISALALIYRALYQGADLRRVDFRQFLEELIAQLIVSDQDNPAPVRTELDADDLIIDPDRVAPIALFAVEAITNAQKHAFAGRGGTLRVIFKVHDENAVLEIADDGSGKAEIGEGVGRTLMSAFARQLRGSTSVAPNLWGGVTARLEFPLVTGAGQAATRPPKPKARKSRASMSAGGTSAPPGR